MDAWTRIESWLEENCEDIAEDLRPPAMEAEIGAAEQSLSVTLPPEMLEVYRGHDGQEGDGAPLDGDWEFLSLEDAVRQWEIQRKLMAKESFANAPAVASGPVRPVWWNVRWIPVAYNGAGDLRCVDLDPDAGGRVGQVVVYWHARQIRECIAGSLTEWLERLADELESGEYEVVKARLRRKGAA